MSVYDCCYHCEKRKIFFNGEQVVSCHSTCKEYKDAVEENKGVKAKKKADSDVLGYLSDKAYRSKKRTGNSGKDVKW